MDTKQKKAFLFLAALIALALLFWFKSRQVITKVAPAEPQADQDPINWPNGIYPGPDNMWGGSPFDSTINVNIGPGAGWLASHYMPAFGLVGVTAIKG